MYTKKVYTNSSPKCNFYVYGNGKRLHGRCSAFDLLVREKIIVDEIL